MFESCRCATQGPPDDDPFDKPLEVNTINLKKSLGSDLKYVGCVAAAKRNDGKADITLTFNGENFMAHKYVLRAQSERFKWEAAFQPQPTPKKKKKRPVIKENTVYNLNDILPDDFPPSVIDQAINFMYTGLLPLFPDKGFLDFFAIAVAFELNIALHIYRKYLAPIYDHPHHVLTNQMVAFILSECLKITKPPDYSLCAEELLCIFVDVCTYLKFTKKETVCSLAKDADFLKHLSYEAALKFLGREDIAKEVGELEVLNFALAWSKYDEKNRKKYSKDLLQKIHLGVLSRDQLKELMEDKTITGCKQMIEKVLKLMDCDEENAGQLQMTQPGLFAERGTLPIKTLVGIGPGFGGRQRLVYFNTHGPKHTLGWRDWCAFAPIPDTDFPIYDASVLEVNGKLYVAGGCDNTYRKHHSYLQPFRWFPAPCTGKWTTNSFYEGNLGVNTLQHKDSKETLTINITNPWSMLTPMKKRRRMFPMVHLDGYLYAIGGQDDANKAMKEVERYNFQQKKWEQLSDLPVPCYYACATAYKGKILVYGSQPVPNEETPAQHNLQMYDPGTKKWTNLLTEYYKITKFMLKEDDPETDENVQEESKEEVKGSDDKKQQKKDDEEEDDNDDDDDEWSDCDSEGVSYQDRMKEKREIGSLQPRNAIVIDGNQCYRLLYTSKAVKIIPRSKLYMVQPVVHQLQLNFNGNKPSAKIGKPQSQKLVPPTGDGAFQINNNIYVNMKGCVYKTGVKIAPGQKKKVNMGVWEKLQEEGCDFEDLTVANFSFDKKAVFCEICQKGGNCCEESGDDDSLFEDSTEHCSNVFQQYVNDRNMAMFGKSFQF